MVVRRVQLWHEGGTSIEHAMFWLCTYLGHAKITDTYWYLSAQPELMAQAMAPTGAVRTKLLNTAAITACRLKNVVRARHYYALVSPATKPVLAQSCLRELGIDLAAE